VAGLEYASAMPTRARPTAMGRTRFERRNAREADLRLAGLPDLSRPAKRDRL